jgi:hypothetical protein
VFERHEAVPFAGGKIKLFTMGFVVDTELVAGIFEHLNEETLLDWIIDYFEMVDFQPRNRDVEIWSNDGDVFYRTVRMNAWDIIPKLTSVPNNVVQFRMKTA